MALGLNWDEQGERYWHTGVDRVALYVWDDTAKKYGSPVEWNGVTAINESPSGAESNKQYADNKEYLNILSKEEFGCTIEAFQSPEEFDQCDGTLTLLSTATGVGILGGALKVHSQTRKTFAIVYRTLKGNDEKTDIASINANRMFSYHIVYGCKASPSSRDNGTVNETPEAQTLSWEITTTPIGDATKIGTILSGMGITEIAHLEIDCSSLTAANVEALETALFGTDTTPAAQLPWPDDLAKLGAN